MKVMFIRYWKLLILGGKYKKIYQNQKKKSKNNNLKIKINILLKKIKNIGINKS